MAEAVITIDPFLLYKPKNVTINVVFLNDGEFSKLADYDFSQRRLEEVRDCYIFCCYTGLPYLEMSSLRKENINKGFDGNLWITIWRQKTNKQLSIPLLPQVKAILDKYDDPSRHTLLPVISNQKFNSYLKEIADILGIKKKLTHHTSRHSIIA